MSTIFYSMAGEGRGHATRVRGLIEKLREDNEIKLYAADQAFELLEPIYKKSDIEIKKLPGLRWTYNKNKKLNYAASAANAVKYLRELTALVEGLCSEIREHKPDLIITDFDPALPRAAKRCGIPFVSFDHQHFLTSYNLSSLPVQLRAKAAFMAPAVNLFYSGQMETIVSSFYFPPLKKDRKNTRQIGILINKEITGIKPLHGDYIVVYLRKFAYPGMLDALFDCGYPVKLYGLGKQRRRFNVEFYDIDFFRFIEHLSGSKALITTAGNQVIGEALYLSKPVLAIPEAGNFEQEINGYFLKESGGGDTVSMRNLTKNVITEFMRLNEFYRLKIDPIRKKICGNNDAVRLISKCLEGGERVKPSPSLLRERKQAGAAT